MPNCRDAHDELLTAHVRGKTAIAYVINVSTGPDHTEYVNATRVPTTMQSPNLKKVIGSDDTQANPYDRCETRGLWTQRCGRSVVQQVGAVSTAALGQRAGVVEAVISLRGRHPAQTCCEWLMKPRGRQAWRLVDPRSRPDIKS